MKLQMLGFPHVWTFLERKEKYRSVRENYSCWVTKINGFLVLHTNDLF